MEEKRTKIVLHPDTDAGIAQWLLRKILLEDKPVEYVFVPPGHRYQGDDAEPGYIFHIDTGGIYAPEKGYFDHHGLSPNHPKYGKCSALLVLEYFEEVFKCNFPAELKTLAWFAQSVDKEKEKEKDEKFNLYTQDPISAPILVRLPEEISLSSRARVSMDEIMSMINCKIATYLEKRKESITFGRWYYENLEKKVRIKKTKWEIPALIVYECPYDSGDFRNLVRYYIRLHSFIIAHYLPTPGRNYYRYGVNKPDGMPQPDLHRIERLLCDRYPQLENENTKLFVHNSGLFLYLNEIPEDLSFEGFIKIVLEEG